MSRRPTVSDLAHNALVVVDLQVAFQDPSFGRGNNSGLERRVAQLVRRWRTLHRPVVFVRHHEADPASPFGPGPGRHFDRALEGSPDLLVTKSVHSAFYGRPRLAPWLRRRHIDSVTVCGITTDHCCDTTARMASDLGFRVYFVTDATRTFDRRAPDGRRIPADEVAARVSASLDGEFATVVRTRDLTA